MLVVRQRRKTVAPSPLHHVQALDARDPTTLAEGGEGLRVGVAEEEEGLGEIELWPGMEEGGVRRRRGGWARPTLGCT